MQKHPAQTLRFVDSHTGGEPTRVIVDGVPELSLETTKNQPSAFDCREALRANHDWIRRASVLEPRGHDAVVGALLCQPADTDCATGVVFFNNAGYLNMCGHGLMGVVVTLAHLGRIEPGHHRIETPVGQVEATLHEDNRVTLTNVPSYRTVTRLALEIEGFGKITGDVAWGGNWFFLSAEHGQAIEFENIHQLTECAWSIRRALEHVALDVSPEASQGLIDHIELFGPASGDHADARSFVLCPGKEYDRSPCGTGTSAKLACLAAEGKLAEGEIWRQESITGSLFEASYKRLPTGGAENAGKVVNVASLHSNAEVIVQPSVTGSAFVTVEGTLLLNQADPFRLGIQSLNG